MKKNRIVWITLAVLMVMLLSCATEKAPAGGPEDKTPPKCLLQTPANGSVNISHTQPVSLVFNEKLSTSFSENNITLFPIGAAEFKVSVRQKNLTIIPDPFWPDTSVFTLNINRNLKDRHGNSIENSLQ